MKVSLLTGHSPFPVSSPLQVHRDRYQHLIGSICANAEEEGV